MCLILHILPSHDVLFPVEHFFFLYLPIALYLVSFLFYLIIPLFLSLVFTHLTLAANILFSILFIGPLFSRHPSILPAV